MHLPLKMSKYGKNAQPKVFFLREERLLPAIHNLLYFTNMRQHLFIELSEKALQALVLVATWPFAVISNHYTPQQNLFMYQFCHKPPWLHCFTVSAAVQPLLRYLSAHSTLMTDGSFYLVESKGMKRLCCSTVSISFSSLSYYSTATLRDNTTLNYWGNWRKT